MNRTFSLLKLCILLAALLISSAPDAAAAETRFRPEQFFAGRTRSPGVFENTFGKPRQRFTTKCRGRMRGDTLWLDCLKAGKRCSRENSKEDRICRQDSGSAWQSPAVCTATLRW